MIGKRLKSKKATQKKRRRKSDAEKATQEQRSYVVELSHRKRKLVYTVWAC